MKKWFSLLLVFLLIPVYTNAKSADLLSAFDELGNFCSLFISEKSTQYSVLPEHLPCPLTYEGKEISINAFDVYQAKKDHGFLPFVHIQIDVSKLTEDEVYWLRKQDLSAIVSYSDPSKANDIHIMKTIVNMFFTDIKVIDMVFYNETISRYPFNDKDFSVTLFIEHQRGQDIIFDSKQYTISKTKASQFTPASECEPKDLSGIDEYLYRRIQTALAK